MLIYSARMSRFNASDLKVLFRRWRQNGCDSFFNDHGNREDENGRREQNWVEHETVIGPFFVRAVKSQQQAHSCDEHTLDRYSSLIDASMHPCYEMGNKVKKINNTTNK